MGIARFPSHFATLGRSRTFLPRAYAKGTGNASCYPHKLDLVFPQDTRNVQISLLFPST